MKQCYRSQGRRVITALKGISPTSCGQPKADVPLSDTTPLCRYPLRARPRRGGDLEK